MRRNHVETRRWNENGDHHLARLVPPVKAPQSWWLCPAGEFYRRAHVRDQELRAQARVTYQRSDLE